MSTLRVNRKVDLEHIILKSSPRLILSSQALHGTIVDVAASEDDRQVLMSSKTLAGHVLM